MSASSDPLEVVSAWLDAGHTLNQGLQTGPEPNPFQGVVEPARGDAEVGLMWGHVVDSVVLLGQYYVGVLEEGDPGGQPRVRVRPLVDLIGERNEERGRRGKEVEGVPVGDGVIGESKEGDGHGQQRQEHGQAVVTIGLYDVVPGDGCGVHVMLTEWTNERLKYYRKYINNYC